MSDMRFFGLSNGQSHLFVAVKRLMMTHIGPCGTL